MPATAPAPEVARRGTRPEQRPQKLVQMRSARKPSQLLQIRASVPEASPGISEEMLHLMEHSLGI